MDAAQGHCADGNTRRCGVVRRAMAAQPHMTVYIDWLRIKQPHYTMMLWISKPATPWRFDLYIHRFEAVALKHLQVYRFSFLEPREEPGCTPSASWHPPY